VSETRSKQRRWTVLASGLLCGLLALVILYTSRSVLVSPVAVVVVAAIGFAAVLLQLRSRNRDQAAPFHPPMWPNVLGALFAFAALFSDLLRLSRQVTQLLALGAVGIFGVSGAWILHSFRRQRAASKS
jgi:uncharacterized membrane protein